MLSDMSIVSSGGLQLSYLSENVKCRREYACMHVYIHVQVCMYVLCMYVCVVRWLIVLINAVSASAHSQPINHSTATDNLNKSVKCALHSTLLVV